MACWSLWPLLLKSAGKYRFELFYYDLSLGLLAASLVSAYTLGTFGSDITFMDNVTIIRLTQIVYALVAGTVCNLGILLFLAAAAVSGVGVAGSITAAAALCMSTGLQFYLAPKGNAWIALSGGMLAVICAALTTRGYHFFLQIKAKDDFHKTPMRKPPDTPSAWKGVLLSIAAGLFAGGIVPLFEKARVMELEMGAYAMTVMFSLGWMVSAPVFSMYFLNLPVQGKPLSPFTYFKATGSSHLKGFLAGLIFGLGLLAVLLGAIAPPEISQGLPMAGPILSASLALASLGGILKWKEFEDAPYRSKSMVLAASVLTIVAACAIAVALITPAT
jgi:glucose uptake protein